MAARGRAGGRADGRAVAARRGAARRVGARRGASGRVGARRDAARRGAARRVSFNNLFSLGVWRGWECGGAGSVEVERHASCRLACANALAYQSSIKHFDITLM